MKKTSMLVLLIICLLLAGSSMAFASTLGQISLKDSLTGKTKAYTSANLMLDGKFAVTDVPAILFEVGGKTRTLVPIRFITDNLGAQVTWDNDTKEATIVIKDKVIVLEANSSIALVDGIPYTLPDNVPVKLLGNGDNYRTLVPVRFVSEQLGLDVGWIQDSKTVTIRKPLAAVKSVQFENDQDRPELIFKTTEEVQFSTRFLDGKKSGDRSQLIIEMTDTLFDLENKASIDLNGTSHLEIRNSNILSIEGSQTEVVPYRTRFIVNMDRELEYDTEYDPETSEIRLTFEKTIGAVKPEPIPVTVPEPDYRAKTVVIDAGHGGNDPGATSPFSRVMEKTLNLKIAQKLKTKLEYIGFKVYMTRSDDTYIGLYDRSGLANNLNVDAFLSIHINASAKQDPNGVEMLYVPDTRDSKTFAQILQTQVCKETGARSIGLIQRPNLVVIRETKMPAVLAELGFLTNPGEEQLLLTDAYQDKLVQGMYNGVTQYLGSGGVY